MFSKQRNIWACSAQAPASRVVSTTVHCNCLQPKWRTNDLQALAAQHVVNVNHRVRPRLCQKVHQLHAGNRGFASVEAAQKCPYDLHNAPSHLYC